MQLKNLLTAVFALSVFHSFSQNTNNDHLLADNKVNAVSHAEFVKAIGVGGIQLADSTYGNKDTIKYSVTMLPCNKCYVVGMDAYYVNSTKSWLDDKFKPVGSMCGKNKVIACPQPAGRCA